MVQQFYGGGAWSMSKIKVYYWDELMKQQEEQEDGRN